MAKDVMKVHPNVNIVIIMPLKENGAYDLGEYTGHSINSININGKIYYFDYESQHIMTSRQEVLDWYDLSHGKYPNSKAEMWDLRYERPPFGIRWHYT